MAKKTTSGENQKKETKTTAQAKKVKADVTANVKAEVKSAVKSEKTGTEKNQKLTINAQSGNYRILRIFVKNNYLTPILVRLSIDDWVTDDGRIFPMIIRVEPDYLYILQGGNATATISLFVPENLKIGEVLKSNLRFPGSNEMAYQIQATIISPTRKSANASEEISANIEIPFGKPEDKKKYEEDHKVSQSIYHLVSGLANLSVLPSQWIFAEILVLICIQGEKQAKNEKGLKFSRKLSQTRFFKNLTVAFATSRFPQWIEGNIISASSIHAAMGGQYGQGRIVYIWLKWLFSMVDIDIEDKEQQIQSLNIPVENMEEAVSRYGNDPEIWTKYLLLGLSSISPKIEDIITSISENVPDEPEKPTRQKKTDDIINEPGSISR